VLVAGLRSQRGASHELLALLRAGKWTLVLSNTVLGEYHEVLHREADAPGLTRDSVQRALRKPRAWAPCAGAFSKDYLWAVKSLGRRPKGRRFHALTLAALRCCSQRRALPG